MEKEFKDYSVFTARVVLGLIFAAAGVMKVSDPSGFAEIIANYQILPGYLVNDAAFFLPYLEIIIAIMLFAGIFLKGTSLLALLMMLSFTAALIFNVSRGLDISCGCFTSVSEEVTSLSYIYYIIRDLIFVLISFSVVRNAFKRA